MELIRAMADAKRIGIHAKLEKADFQVVRKRMWTSSPRPGWDTGAVQGDDGLDLIPPPRTSTAA